jgi:hypothetical protein
MERMASSAEAGSQLTDVLLAPSELTAMREALRPLGERIADDRVTAVLLVAAAVDHATTQRSVIDLLRILAHIRREFSLPTDVSSTRTHVRCC